jgi:hypothetical protein
MAMWPASSVSGYYFGNRKVLGKIKEDQVIDYAKRRSVPKEVATKPKYRLKFCSSLMFHVSKQL